MCLCVSAHVDVRPCQRAERASTYTPVCFLRQSSTLPPLRHLSLAQCICMNTRRETAHQTAHETGGEHAVIGTLGSRECIPQIHQLKFSRSDPFQCHNTHTRTHNTYAPVLQQWQMYFQFDQAVPEYDGKSFAASGLPLVVEGDSEEED